MTVLELHSVAKRYTSEPLLESISFKLGRGEKVGLIGGNGCGKSTLLKMIAGLEPPSAGAITRPTGASLGYLAQELQHTPGRPVWSELLQAVAPLRELGQQVRRLELELSARPDDEALLKRYSRMARAFEERGGYEHEHRAEAVLQGLGLAARRDQPVDTLSGGEKNVLALARLLLAEPEILLLDEPANHLDFAGLEWLEDLLRHSAWTVLLVSHNRFLLDRVVGRVLEIEDRRLTAYAGNYSAYRAEKMRRVLAQQVAWHDQQKEIRRIEAMIRRFEEWSRRSDNPQHARRARNKQGTLDRMERVARPELERRGIGTDFGEAARAGHIALQLRGYSRAFGERVLFEQVELEIVSGERVGLLGANGSGKSTLFRDIVAEAAWDHPVLRLGPRIRLGYYAQEHETLDPNKTLTDALLGLPRVTRDVAFRTLLRFLFRPPDMERRVATLSGGEKSRLQLARLVLAGANFLLLDEPTNHLDIPSCEQVEEALEAFEGTLLVISHDRYFLDRLVERIVEVQNPRLVDYPGSFSWYWAKRRAARLAAQPRAEHGSAERRAPTGPRASQKPRPAPLPATEVDALQARIEALEAQRRRVEADLAAAYQRRDRGRGGKLSAELQRLNAAISELYEAWEQTEQRVAVRTVPDVR